jgi:hypothetical protein
MSDQGVMRSYAQHSEINNDMTTRNVLLGALHTGHIPYQQDDRSHAFLYTHGILHRALDSRLNDALVFPSKIHAQYVAFRFGDQDKPFPYEKFQSIEQLCAATLRSFSRLMLKELSDIKRLGHEFYRALWVTLGPGHEIQSEWSGSGHGRVDIFIGRPGWGVEIVRDGNGISECIGRFNPGGLYYPWIQSGRVKDWLILDCRNIIPGALTATESTPSSELWRVVFTDDYAMVDLRDSRNLQTEPRFGLAN